MLQFPDSGLPDLVSNVFKSWPWFSLPPYETVTIYHLKDLIAGKKKTMSTEKVKYLYCPQYNSLSLKKIFRIIHEQNQIVLQYLPVEKEYEKFPRQYILNLIYSICGEGFRDFV